MPGIEELGLKTQSVSCQSSSLGNKGKTSGGMWAMAEARAGALPGIGKVRSSMGALESSTEDTTRVLIIYLASPWFAEHHKNTSTSECVSARIENRDSGKISVSFIHFNFIYHSQMMRVIKYFLTDKCTYGLQTYHGRLFSFKKNKIWTGCGGTSF